VAKRRAYADEYAVRVNRAVALLGDRSPVAAARALEVEHGLSERQARRYVRVAQRCPGGVAVPERTVVFTVRLPESLIARVRGAAALSGGSLSATTAHALLAGLERVERARERNAEGGARR
jgi:hypothetical protein